MDYNQITSFLDKFKKLIYQKEETKEAIIETIKQEVSYALEKDNIKTKNGCIYIQGSPILRGEILMHKEQILKKLAILLLESRFFDIK